MQRLRNILIAFDQLIYVLLTLGWGMPDETMSSAAWRSEQTGKVLGSFFRPLIDRMFWYEPNHCKKSFDAERRRSQLPEELRVGVTALDKES